MNEYLQRLKTKYGYDDELLNLLYSVIPSLIEYYGDDKRDLILSAIEDTEIIIGHGFEFLRKNGANAAIATRLEKIPDGFKVHRRIYANRTMQKDIFLVHELCHLVKSYGQERYEDGLYIIKIGLNFAAARYDEEKNKFEAVSEDDAMDELFNDYDTYMVAKMAGLDTSSIENSDTIFMLQSLSKNVDFQNDIQKGQFTDDKTYIATLGNFYPALKNFKENTSRLAMSGILNYFATPRDMYKKESWHKLNIEPNKKRELLIIFTDYMNSLTELWKMVAAQPTI